MNDLTIGTCSICGGAVTLPTIFWSVVPPVPSCSRCGATKRQPHGPVIDMEPVRWGTTADTKIVWPNTTFTPTTADPKGTDNT